MHFLNQLSNVILNIKINDSSCFEISNDSSGSFYFLLQQIRSMRKNFDNFLIHLSSLSNKPSIIFLTEIWVFENEVSLYSIPGYTQFSKPYSLNVSGGVMVFVRDDINCSSCSINAVTADILKINCVIGGKKIGFLCIYRRHDRSNPEMLLPTSFLEELPEILSQ